MGEIADLVAAKKSFPGCSVERALRAVEEEPGDLDSDDLTALRDILADPDHYSHRVVDQIFRRVGIKVLRQSISAHRQHGDCSLVTK